MEIFSTVYEQRPRKVHHNDWKPIEHLRTQGGPEGGLVKTVIHRQWTINIPC